MVDRISPRRPRNCGPLAASPWAAIGHLADAGRHNFPETGVQIVPAPRGATLRVRPFAKLTPSQISLRTLWGWVSPEAVVGPPAGRGRQCRLPGRHLRRSPRPQPPTRRPTRPLATFSGLTYREIVLRCSSWKTSEWAGWRIYGWLGRSAGKIWFGTSCGRREFCSTPVLTFHLSSFLPARKYLEHLACRWYPSRTGCLSRNPPGPLRHPLGDNRRHINNSNFLIFLMFYDSQFQRLHFLTPVGLFVTDLDGAEGKWA